MGLINVAYKKSKFYDRLSKTLTCTEESEGNFRYWIKDTDCINKSKNSDASKFKLKKIMDRGYKYIGFILAL